MSVAEWTSLTWWEQRIYREGLLAEMGAAPEETTAQAGDELTQLQGLGMTVRKV